MPKSPAERKATTHHQVGFCSRPMQLFCKIKHIS
nr:MAG TPA: hypothetical protein [Caudoviricetes sp.]